MVELELLQGCQCAVALLRELQPAALELIRLAEPVFRGRDPGPPEKRQRDHDDSGDSEHNAEREPDTHAPNASGGSGFGCRRGPSRGHPVAVLFAEAAGRIFGQRVAVALPVGGAHEGSDDIEIPVVDLGRLTPEVGEPKVDIELQQVDAAWAFRHGKSVESRSDDTRGKPCFPREPPFFLEPALQQRLRLPPGEARLRRRYAASPWASFVLDRLEFPHARLRRRPSSY